MVEQGAKPRISKARRYALRAAKALTTPLLPDDYLELINPMWSSRELRGNIEEIRSETPDASTIVIRPNFEWLGHVPGQYLRIGATINGVRHWRAYTLTSDPDHPRGLISVSIKHVPEGKLSPYFTRQCEPEQIVYLGGVEGTFALPHPLPEKMLFVSAGSGITPVWAMLRHLDRRSALEDAVHVHSDRTRKDVMFAERFSDLNKRNKGYRRHEQLTKRNGRIKAADLDEVCPDWRERETFLSGPGDMLDAFSEHWAADEKAENARLHMERFQPKIGGEATAEVGSGGTVRFRITEFEAECDGKTPILEGAEQAGGALPYGCRMGVCHTCIGKLCSGQVRDLRTGEVHGEAGQMIRTCVNAPEGPIELDL